MRVLTHPNRAPIVAISTAGALLGPLLSATQPSDETLIARESIDERDNRRRGEQDDSRRREDDFIAVRDGGAAAQMQSAEREMRPGSQALARDQARSAAFRDEWQNATRSATTTSDHDGKANLSAATDSKPHPRGDSTFGPAPQAAAVEGASSTPAGPTSAGSSAADSPSNALTQAQTAVRPQNAAPSSNSISNQAGLQFAPTVPRDSGSGGDNAPVGEVGGDTRAATAVERSSSAASATHRNAIAAISPTRGANLSSRALGLANDAPTEPQIGRNEPMSEQIVRVVRSRINEKHTTATLRLDPPALGSVRMYMDLRENQLVLRVEPQGELAHRLLCEQTDSLRVALESAGIQLQRVEIVAPPDATAFAAAGGDGGAAGNMSQFGDARRDGADRALPGDTPTQVRTAVERAVATETASISVSELLGNWSGVNVLA